MMYSASIAFGVEDIVRFDGDTYRIVSRAPDRPDAFVTEHVPDGSCDPLLVSSEVRHVDWFANRAAGADEVRISYGGRR